MTTASLEPRATSSPAPDLTPEVRRTRSPQRADLRIFCKAVDLTTGASWQVECCDVSEWGICLVMRRCFEPRTLLLIELQTDRELAVGSLLVRVVWTEKDRSGGWRVGCALRRSHQKKGLSS